MATTLMAVMVLAACSAAQTRTVLDPQPPPDSLTIRRLVPEVEMVFSARDQQGNPVASLCAPQITVLDNGVAAPLTSLQAADDLPLRAALLLDGSDSMRPGFAALRQAGLDFLRRLQRSGCDQTFAVTFAAGEASGNEAGPDGGLPVHQAGGQTALYDALIAAAGRLRSGAPGRLLLLLLSDGDDNYSRATLAEALAALQQGNIVVYSMMVHNPRLEYPGDRVLRQIAAATGGRSFRLRSYRELRKVLPVIEHDLRGQYVLGFRPPGRLAAGEFHSVQVIAVPPGTVIRARSGYYVDPQD